MSKPYDALTRALFEARPNDWLAMLGFGRNLPVAVANSHISTVTAEVDKVLLVDEPGCPWLVHVEIQAGYDPSLPRRLLRYNAMLDYRHERPVHSAVVLLWREADGPAFDGVLHRQPPQGDQCRTEFHYQVIRVWELSVEGLAEGLGTLPLAALAARTVDDLEGIVSRMRETLDCDPPLRDEGELWASLFILIGRRFDQTVVARFIKGARKMKDSSTYQLILREGRDEGLKEGLKKGLKKGLKEGLKEGLVKGRVEEGRTILLRQGRIRFGEPDATVRGRIEAIDDLGRLEELSERLLIVGSWGELLGDAGSAT